LSSGSEVKASFWLTDRSDISSASSLLDVGLLVCSCVKLLALAFLEQGDGVAICCDNAAVEVDLIVLSKDLFLFCVEAELVFLLGSELLVGQTKRIVSLDTHNSNASCR
jgi:hypothetical protein